MSPRTSEQFGKIRQEKKKLILDTSLELFAENGFHATSISQIAKKAKISKGLIYNYFKSKNDILEEISNAGFHHIFTNFDPNHDGILTEEEFEFFIRKSFSLVMENHRFWKLYFSLMVQPKIAENFHKEYEEVAGPMLNMMREFIITKGSTDPDGDLMVISALIEGAFLYTIVAPELFPSKVMEDKVINAIPRIITKKIT